MSCPVHKVAGQPPHHGCSKEGEVDCMTSYMTSMVRCVRCATLLITAITRADQIRSTEEKKECENWILIDFPFCMRLSSGPLTCHCLRIAIDTVMIRTQGHRGAGCLLNCDGNWYWPKRRANGARRLNVATNMLGAFLMQFTCQPRGGKNRSFRR